MTTRIVGVLLALAAHGLPAPALRAFAAESAPAASGSSFRLFDRTNLVAWCIVPFDAKKRGPEERAAMLERLGFRLFAYDYRAEHIPTFDAEMAALERHHVRLLAWWFPGAMNDEARLILGVLQRHGIRDAQLWVTGSGEPPKNAAEYRTRVEAEAQRIRPIADEARKLGCAVALYNHGGWFGEPENQIAIIERLRASGVTNVGIVYNLHHGHGHLDRFAELMQQMKPYLLALNLNGMVRDGESSGKKILPLGQGDLDLGLLKSIRDSRWRGPIGILNHTDEDAEARLRDNLDGLDWLVARLDGRPAGPKPKPRSWREAQAGPASRLPQPVLQPSKSAAFGQALAGGMVVEGKPEYRTLPITVECWAKLTGRAGFNILVASDTKASAEHWEIYSYAGSGVFSVYQPGRGGEFKSDVHICDGQWHYLAAILEPARVRLFVDGKLALDKPAKTRTGAAIPGELAFGRLVEGAVGCDGVVDDVRLSQGAREIQGVPGAPLQSDAQTIGLWNFDELPASAGTGTPAAFAHDLGSMVTFPLTPALSPGERENGTQPLVPAQRSDLTRKPVDYWTIEDPKEREKLPLYQIIPAAKPEELTPANGFPKRETYLNWHRSHSDNGGTRYSALDQINRRNVTNLQVAWIYHSKDGRNNIQCNPIVVNGVMFAPTPGKHIVAVNAENGTELWRFKPEGRPAFRGLIYRPARDGAGERVLFCAGHYLYALDPKTGRPLADFGDGGRALLPGVAQGDFGAATAAPTLFERILVVPGFEKDVWGFDVVTGRHLWTFHTVPHPGEFGYDTWDRPESYAANCWGGMAMDEVRGIAYITTGSPKPNFTGMYHLGQNLFANCVVALDARTGRRLWHFQEIRHDIWDLDIPAPPNLATITRDGRRVDVVTAVTKIGNTLLLDRVTGKPIFPFRLRRAPTSEVRGERTWPYQPDPELPERFSKMESTEADLTQRNEEVADYALTRYQSMHHG
jgi:outer membrane protein assembly factor BamB/sugar phosphate isomerase/epimerase